MPLWTRADDACACNPIIYSWKLDFSNTCDSPRNITHPELFGVEYDSLTCSISPAEEPDLLTFIRFEELNNTDHVIYNFTIDSEKVLGKEFFSNGDKFSHESLIFLDHPPEHKNGLPTKLRISAIGNVTSADGTADTTFLNITIPFTNECETPVFDAGHTFAWFVFDNPNPFISQEHCNLPSEEPSQSISPSSSPTEKPSLSLFPSVSPSSQPSKEPSGSPSDEVSVACIIISSIVTEKLTFSTH